MHENDQKFSEAIKHKAAEAQQNGKTAPFLAVGGNVVGVIVISDKIKPSSKLAIKKLLSVGIDVMMMTGDNENTASAVSREVGIPHFKANCLPEDKLNEVKKLQAEGRKVAMAGDGTNDALH